MSHTDTLSYTTDSSTNGKYNTIQINDILIEGISKDLLKFMKSRFLQNNQRDNGSETMIRIIEASQMAQNEKWTQREQISHLLQLFLGSCDPHVQTILHHVRT